MGWFDSLFSEDTDWGGIIAAGASTMLSGKDARKQSKEEWKNKLDQIRVQFQGQRELGAQNRQWELEDRRFKADSVGSYGQFYTGPQVERPAPVDTTVTLRDLPPELGGKAPEAAPAPKKSKKKKKGWLKKLFG